MLPDNSEYHSLEQIALIQRLSREPSLGARDALFLATQLVHHGFAHAGALVDRLRTDMRSASAGEYLLQLRRRHGVIQSLPLLTMIQSDQKASLRLLEKSGYVFRPGSFRNDKAVVIFTTKFNNFGVSNIVLDAFLAQLGVARLFLKDNSEFAYFNGVEGLASSLGDLPRAVADLLAAQGIRQTIVTGFSSGGYAALHLATARRYAGYVGYAVCTDLSENSGLPLPKYYARLRERVAPGDFLDLRTRLEGNPEATPCKLFFGKNDVVDRAHAVHLVDCPTVELTCHADSAHEVTLQLIGDGSFLEPFEQLLEGLRTSQQGQDPGRPA